MPSADSIGASRLERAQRPVGGALDRDAEQADQREGREEDHGDDARIGSGPPSGPISSAMRKKET